MLSGHHFPEHDQCFNVARITKGSRLQVHADFLPHGLPVSGKARCIVHAEQEIIQPVPLSGSIFCQIIVFIEFAVCCRPVHVLVSHGSGFVAVCQQEFEHHLIQVCIHGVFHDALTFQSSCTLSNGDLLCRPAGRCSVGSALETVSNAQGTSCRFILFCNNGLILCGVYLQVMYAKVVSFCGILENHFFQLCVSFRHIGLCVPCDHTAALVHFLLNTGVALFDHVLLIHDLVNVTVSQRLAPAGNILANDDGVNIGLVVGNSGTSQHCLRLCSESISEFIHQDAVLCSFGIFLHFFHHGNDAVSGLDVLKQLHFGAVFFLCCRAVAISAFLQPRHVMGEAIGFPEPVRLCRPRRPAFGTS